MADDFKFLMNDKAATLEDAKNAPILFANGQEKVVHLFSSEPDFNVWAKKSNHAEKIAQIDELVIRSKKYETADNTNVIKRQQKVVQRISNDLENFAKETGLPDNSEELFRRAAIDFHPLEGSIFDPTILYEHINLVGRRLPLAYPPGTYPDFTWLNFNDIASSMMVYGYCKLWEHVWYSGRSVTITGSPALINLTGLGFNDIASSAIVY